MSLGRERKWSYSHQCRTKPNLIPYGARKKEGKRLLPSGHLLSPNSPTLAYRTTSMHEVGGREEIQFGRHMRSRKANRRWREEKQLGLEKESEFHI